LTGLRRSFLLVSILLTSQVLVSIMSGLVLASSPRENIILPGVFVGGIDVGGLSRDQAIKLLGDIVNRKVNNSQVVLRYQERQWSLNYDKLGIGFDVSASVDKALEESGRHGTALSGLIAMLQTRYRTLYLPLVLDVNKDRLQEAIAGINSQISRQAKNAVVNYDDGTVNLVPENVGKEVQLSPSISRIKKAAGQFDERPVDIVVRVIPPRLIRNDLEGIKDSLGIGLAVLLRSGGGPDNVSLVIDRLDGQLIRPGEIFSFNRLVGWNITEEGYLAPKITEGRLESDTGVSRAASALYQAVIYAGLEVRERHAHFSAPGYIALGQDAAVTSRRLDLKFFNNMQTPVYIKASVMGNRIIVNVLGTKTVGRTIQVITQSISDEADTDVRGVEVQRIYYNHGIETKRELLSQDRYK